GIQRRQRALPAAGELEGLQRSDAVRLRAEDERGMLAATHGGDARDIAALQTLLGQASALRERDLLLGLIATQTQALRSALTLERLRLEAAK
ncbi:hypothetical protein, partial [Pantoea dispersa]